MVRIPGVDLFIDRLAGGEAPFVVIGGTAREFIYEEAGYFQDSATKDLDIVLIAEALDARFVDDRFMPLVVEGGYTHCTKDGMSQMYRFSRPIDDSFPFQIELLSRRPDCMRGIERRIGPVKIDDASYSLSAILLVDDYYQLLSSGKAVTDKYGMPTLRHEYLPVFKMKAYNDLRDRRAAGEAIRRDEVNKHRRDIFKFCALPMPPLPVGLPQTVLDEVRKFIEEVECPKGFMKGIGLGSIDAEEIKSIIKSYYLGDS